MLQKLDYAAAVHHVCEVMGKVEVVLCWQWIRKTLLIKKKKRWKKYRPWQSNDIVVLIAKKWPFWHIWHGDDETSVAQNITEYIKERLQRFKKCQTISICGKKISANEEGSVQKMSRIKPQVIQENG